MKGRCVKISKLVGEILLGLLIASSIIYYLRVESPKTQPVLATKEADRSATRESLNNLVIGLPKNVELDRYIEKHDNGEIKLQGKIINGRRSGSWAAFNRDGTPSWTAYYRRGKYHGAYRQWVRYNDKVNRGLEWRLQAREEDGHLVLV